MPGPGDRARRQRVAVGICVVAQHAGGGDAQRRVFLDRVGVGGGDRTHAEAGTVKFSMAST